LKKHPEIQKQHRLSQVYLKQFGFQQGDEWMISVMKLGSGKTENLKISEFTAEENIFDLPFKDFELRRHFENLSSKLETDYPKLINNIKNQKQLTLKNKVLLSHFVPNILCRTSHFRFFINLLIEDIETRKKLLNEITIFQEDDGQTEYLLEILKPETHLNIVVGTLMNHLVYVFSHFKKVVLKSPKGHSWLTSDNPVFMDFQNKSEWIIPIEAEVYFPLSKEYCVFLFSDKSELNSNPLRQLKIDKVNQIDFITFDKLANRIARNLDEYLIFSQKYEPSIIRE
jgi:hypothetical protein